MEVEISRFQGQILQVQEETQVLLNLMAHSPNDFKVFLTTLYDYITILFMIYDEKLYEPMTSLKFLNFCLMKWVIDHE